MYSHKIPWLLILCAITVVVDCPTLVAQAVHPLAQRGVDIRVRGEEVRFLLQSEQITAEQYRDESSKLVAATREWRGVLAKFPRDQQAIINQQTESLFGVRIVPLREQWKQALVEKQQRDVARNNNRRAELTVDAQEAGRLQATRTLLKEKLQQGLISQSEAARADQAAEQQILKLQGKYDAYDASGRPYWGPGFAQNVAAFAARSVAELRLKDRLEDTTSAVGRDARRAVELTLAMQRTEVFRGAGAISPQDAQAQTAAAQAELAAMRGRYGPTVAAAADFNDRVARMVQTESVAQRPQWQRDAVAARDAAAASAASARSAAAAVARTPVAAAPTVSNDVAPPPAPRAATAAPATVRERRPSGMATLPPPGPPPAVNSNAGFLRPPQQTSSSSSWTPIFLLLLVGGAGAGFYVYRGKRQATPPAYSDAMAGFTPPPAPVVEPMSMRSMQEAPAPDPMTSAPLAAGESLKDRLFAEQREKYQARYNDAQDEVTNASMALGQMKPVISGVQQNLKLLSKTLPARMEALIKERFGNPVKILIRAATLRALIPVFGRLSLLLKIIAGVVLFSMVTSAIRSLAAGNIIEVLFPYLLVVAALAVVERYMMLSVPLGMLKKNLDQFKDMKLSYVFANQLPHAFNGEPANHVVRVFASDKEPIAHEARFKSAESPAGSHSLEIGGMISFRFAQSGTITPEKSNPNNEFVQRYDGILTDALRDQTSFASATLPSMTEYGEAMWRKRKAADELPRLEELVRDAERIEDMWRDTYVSDEIFEFVFRGIDMFNMRDAAAPTGMLFYGFPGNGKTYLSKKIAESIGARFEQVAPSKVATADDIKALWENNRGGDPVVLFIPNVDSIFPRIDGGGPGEERALEFVAEWEKYEPKESRVWVIMTARSDEHVDRSILDQIGPDAKIEVKPPDAVGREMLFRAACRLHQIPMPQAGVIKATGGASVQELVRITKQVKRASAPHAPTDAQWQSAIKAVRGADAKYRDETKTWDRLVLPGHIKEQLQVACKMLQDAQEYIKKGAKIPNFLLFGPPGTGKTEIARTIANEGGVNFLDAKMSDIKAGYTGQSGQKVKELFEKARSMAPAVLFLDEIDGVATKRGSADSDSFTKEIVNEMLAQMDGAATQADRPVLVLAATNLKDSIDEAVLRRFPRKVEIPLPDDGARREILKRLIVERAVDEGLDIEETCSALVKKTNGLAGAGLKDLVDRALQQSIGRDGSALNMRLTRANLLAEADALAKAGSDAGDESAGWDSLVLPDDTIRQLKQMCDALKHMETLQKQGFDPPRGAVLFGPPGTGKTQIARTLRNESGVPVLFAGPSDIKAGYVGQSAIKVRELFDRARTKAPCILFIDEFENGASARGGDKADSFSEEIVTELLSQMDGAKKSGRPVFVLAATNHLDRVDSAVLSRFTYKIEIPLPTAEHRERLFEVFLRKYPNVDFDVKETAAELARRAGDIGGRDIQSLVVRASQAAAQRALEAGTTDHVVLGREDLLKQFAPKGAQVTEEDLQKVWAQIVLKPETKESILGMIRMFNRGDKAAPKGLLLYGPPGTGKTEIARLLAKSTGCAFLDVKPSDLKAGYTGQSGKQVKAVWEKARSYGRCVMFVDECDGVFARRGGVGTDSFAEEVVNEFLTMWDGVSAGGQVWVVGATNRRDRFDEAIVSRFGASVEIGLPDAPERLEILRLELRKMEREIEVPEFVGQATAGMAGRNLSKVAQSVCTLAAQKGGAEVTPEMWREVIGGMAKTTSDAVDESANWESLILQDATVKKLKRICEMLTHAELLKEQGIELPKGALLFGPPGTGKTQIAKTMAIESGLNFIAAGPSDIKAGYLGQSGQKVRELFERARSKPSILFIDEIESGAASRSGGKADQFTGEIVTELLTQMEGVKKTGRHVFVLAATNHPSLVDEAVLSRFEERIEIPNPGLDERQRMIKTFIGKRRIDFDVDQAAQELAARCEGMSGRDISALIRRASQQSAQRAMDAGTPAHIVLTRDDLVSQLPAR